MRTSSVCILDHNREQSGLKQHILASTEEDLTKTDAAWVMKLAETFGGDQIDTLAARPEGQGEPDTDLRRAYDARQAALLRWRAARGLD